MKKVWFYLSLLVVTSVLTTSIITGEETRPEGLRTNPANETDPLQALSISGAGESEDPPRDPNPLDQGADACPATVISSLPYTDTGTTAGRVNNWNTAASCAGGGGTSNAPDVIYSYTPSSIQNVVISTCGSAFNTIVEVRANGSCPGATQMGCADAGCGGAAEVRMTLMDGITYYIIIDGWGTQSGNYALTVAQMCDVYAHAGDFIECAESADSSHARLDCNGGPCNVAFGGTASYTEISCGQIYFGQAFTYTHGTTNLYDTDWYRFTVTEQCTVRITAIAEFPHVLSAGFELASCMDHAWVFNGYTCYPSVLTIPNVAPGNYEFTFRPWDAAGIPNPRDYRVLLDCIPTSGCVIDTTLNAPGFVEGNTSDSPTSHCSFRPSPEHTVRVNIPQDGAWTFSLCGSSSSYLFDLFLSTACCGGTIFAESITGCPDDPHNPIISGVSLAAGTYYATIEGQAPDQHGPYLLNVTRCVLDAEITAPATFSGNTCGAGDDCQLAYWHIGEEQTLRVIIPDEDEWSFVLDGYLNYVELSSACCSGLINFRDPAIYCEHLAAGVYFVTVEGYDSTICGPYTLSVERCRYRCCYSDSFRTCTNTWEADCDVLGGIMDYGRDCATQPCPEIPQCPTGAQFTQLPRAPDGWDANAWPSDVNAWSRYYDDFTGLTNPINHVRFWGHNWTGEASCNEDPMPFTVEFRTLSGLEPGDVVATYVDTLPGQPGAIYSLGRMLYQYDMAIDPPLALSDGWISVAGAGDTTCDFWWMTSGLGSEVVCIFNNADSTWSRLGARDMAFCLGGCPEADSLTLKFNSGISFTLSFYAPVDAEYRLYYTALPNAVYPDGFMLASHPELTAGHYDYDINLSSTYQRWLVVTNCE